MTVERVAFLVERTQARVSALLNPEDVVIRRTSGVRPLASASGRATLAGQRDDPLLLTGGGTTELELALLFDVTLVDPPAVATDVRELTAPLWQLAENAGDGYGGPPLARLVWGKAWNFLGVVAALSERLEHFDVDGSPRRSWLRVRMLRVADPAQPATEGSQPGSAVALVDVPPPSDADEALQVLGQGPTVEGGEPLGERLDVLAARAYGDRTWLWRALAAANGLTTAPWAPAGTVLRIPPLPPEATSR